MELDLSGSRDNVLHERLEEISNEYSELSEDLEKRILKILALQDEIALIRKELEKRGIN